MGPLGAAEKAASTSPTATVFDEPLQEAFPDPAKAVYSVLVSVGHHSLYEAAQTDSGVEQRFIQDRLEVDDGPVRLPKMIGGNYNPDWGICVDLTSSEARKIACRYKYFRTLGIDYRAIRDDTLDWLDPTKKEYRIGS